MSEIVGYRKRRWVEALMIVFAIGIGMSGYLITHLDRDAELPPEWPWVLAALGAVGLTLHLVIRWRLPYADPLIVPLVLLLNGLGLAMIHRLDLDDSKAPHSADLQLNWLFVSVVACCLLIIFLRDYRVLHRYTYTIFLAGLVLLMLPLVPGLGEEKHGAQIWIQIGSYSFQPAELAKLVLSIAFASYLVEKRDVLAMAGGRFLGIEFPRPRDLGPILVMWLASLAVLVFQKDLGTSLLFFGLFVMMLYVATEKPSWAILGTLLFAVGAVAGYFLFSHVQVRVSSWLDPFSDYDKNYQVINGQFGMAWGGALGTGWGLGRPNLTPLAKTDFIAAAIGEELGVAGLTAVILLYGIIVARGLRASLVARDPFGKLLAAGLSFVFAIQVFAIIGGVTRLLPLTGLTTPFMSQGGSSLVSNWIMIGLLLIITHQVRSPVAVAPEPEQWLESETTQVVPLATSARTPNEPPSPVSDPQPAAVVPGLGHPDDPTEPAGQAGASELTAPIAAQPDASELTAPIAAQAQPAEEPIAPAQPSELTAPINFQPPQPQAVAAAGSDLTAPVTPEPEAALTEIGIPAVPSPEDPDELTRPIGKEGDPS